MTELFGIEPVGVGSAPTSAMPGLTVGACTRAATIDTRPGCDSHAKPWVPAMLPIDTSPAVKANHRVADPRSSLLKIFTMARHLLHSPDRILPCGR